MAEMNYEQSMSDEEVKKDLVKRKPNACSLSKFKVVHSREDDVEDTLIIRDTWSKARLTRFGVKGAEKIREVFNVLLTLLWEHKEKILPKLKYDQDELEIVVSSITDRDMTDGWGLALGRNYRVNFNEQLAQIELLHVQEEDGSIIDGVKLFTGEVLKLIRHINNVFIGGEERENRNREWEGRRNILESHLRVQSHDSDTFF